MKKANLNSNAISAFELLLDNDSQMSCRAFQGGKLKFHSELLCKYGDLPTTVRTVERFSDDPKMK